MTIPENIVAYGLNKEAVYPSAPFSPGERYPEYPFQSIATSPNHVYALVRDCLRRLGLDPEHFGSKSWNPLGGIVRPGDNLVVKPNWVYHKKTKAMDRRSRLQLTLL